LKVLSLGVGAVIGSWFGAFKNKTHAEENGPFVIPPLPYPKSALEPYMSWQTVEMHYEYHNKTLLQRLNQLVKGSRLSRMTLEEIFMTQKGEVAELAAQIWNHAFFWESLTEQYDSPSNVMDEAFNKSFGSFENFKKEWEMHTFDYRPGWLWLVRDRDSKKLSILNTIYAGNPMTLNKVPLLNCDLWEHAYEDKKYDRLEYIKNFWNIVDWKTVQYRYELNRLPHALQYLSPSKDKQINDN